MARHPLHWDDEISNMLGNRCVCSDEPRPFQGPQESGGRDIDEGEHGLPYRDDRGSSTQPPPPRRTARPIGSTLHLLLLLLLLLLSLLPYTDSQTLSVTVATQPALAVGGSHFLTQPVVNVLDGAGNLHSTFTGKAYASLTESPTGYEEIRYNGSTTDTDNIVDFVEGRGKGRRGEDLPPMLTVN